MSNILIAEKLTGIPYEIALARSGGSDAVLPWYERIIGSRRSQWATDFAIRIGRLTIPPLDSWAINADFSITPSGYEMTFDADAYRPAIVQVRYLDPTGSNSNDGLTPGTAWQTFSHAVSQTSGTATRFICAPGTYANVATWPNAYEIICESGQASLNGFQHVVPSGESYYKGVKFLTYLRGLVGGTRFFDECELANPSGDVTEFDDGIVITRMCTAPSGIGGDVLDYSSSTDALEIQNTITNAGAVANDNISTGHQNCRIVRFGCNYSDSPRPVHDVNNCKVQMIDCIVNTSKSGSSDPYDSFCLGAGQQEASGETVRTDIYGGTYGGGAVADLFVDSDCELHVNADVQYSTAEGNIVQDLISL